MTTIALNVPRERKDEAKALGARWNPTGKTWYVAAGTDLAPFAALGFTATAPAASPTADRQQIVDAGRAAARSLEKAIGDLQATVMGVTEDGIRAMNHDERVRLRGAIHDTRVSTEGKEKEISLLHDLIRAHKLPAGHAYVGGCFLRTNAYGDHVEVELEYCHFDDNYPDFHGIGRNIDQVRSSLTAIMKGSNGWTDIKDLTPEKIEAIMGWVGPAHAAETHRAIRKLEAQLEALRAA